MHVPTTPAVELLRTLRDEVRRDTPRGRVMVAVDGFDGAGKTMFADAWADVFAETGVAVYRASLDDFHRPRAERHARGRDSAEGFYRDSFDYATFRRVLVDPFRGGVDSGGFQLTAFDVARDAPRQAHWVTAPRDAVLIVDGIFALRPELRGLWNSSVWLDVPFETTFARMAARDGCDPDPDAPSNARYRDGQLLYLRDANPRRRASMVVDNTDGEHPVRVLSDFC